jgi:hypothetical protein
MPQCSVMAGLSPARPGHRDCRPRAKCLDTGAVGWYEADPGVLSWDTRLGGGIVAAEPKRRTREHVIADMSFHHLGYLVVRSGFTLEANRADYGYDGSIFTFDRHGRIENSYMFVQLKATDRIRFSADRKRVLFRVSKKDLSLWQDEIVPVYLVVFDAKREKAYWIYFQKYIEQRGIRAAMMKTESITVELGATQVVNRRTIVGWRRDKMVVLASLGEVTHA